MFDDFYERKATFWFDFLLTKSVSNLSFFCVLFFTIYKVDFHTLILVTERTVYNTTKRVRSD